MKSLIVRFSLLILFAGNFANNGFGQVNLRWDVHTPSMTNSTGVAMAIDTNENTYITGSSIGPSTGCDFLTRKISPDGAELWSARYDNGGNEQAAAIAVDKSGNVYVTGNTLTNEIITVKYDPNGTQIWARHYFGPAGGADKARGIAIDRDGNIFVTSQIFESTMVVASRYYVDNFAILTIKYDSNGNQLWSQRYSGGGGYRDASAMTLDTNGNIYVAGPNCVFADPRAPVSELLILKYNTIGTQVGLASYSQKNGNGTDTKVALSARGTNEIYCAASMLQTESPYYLMLKFTNNTLQWGSSYSRGELFGSDTRAYIQAMLTDPAGNMYVTGGAKSNQYDYATVKLDANGNQLWAARYNGPANADDIARAITLDEKGNVYVTGSSVGTNNTTETATIKYAKDGTELWVARSGNTTGISGGTAIATTKEGRILITGYTPSVMNPNTLDYYAQEFVQWGRNIRMLPNGHVRIENIELPDGTNSIQFSTNLVDWTDRATKVSDSFGMTIFEEPSTFSRGFYRISRSQK